MNKQALDQMWDQFRQMYGVYLRVLEAIPADRFPTHPVPGMRSPAELLVHISGTIVRDIVEGVAKGQITVDEAGESKVAADLGNKPALLAFARECFDRAHAAIARIGDAELKAMVPTPWGSAWPGTVAFHIMRDEFVHHRGQLTAFVRLCGGEPPFIWGYADNAPEYQPRAVSEPAGA
ncbi:MAG TPA: DinB family protein [Gemmatimonadales bacterium]|nr:DinB family protein [Gemmatimonadales bacterium]